MYTVILSAQDNHIHLKFPLNLSIEDNNSVNTWWQEYTVSSDPGVFIVPIHIFLIKRGWFRTHWANKGYLLLDPGKTVAELIHKVELQQNSFMELATQNNRVFNPILEELPLKRKLLKFQNENVQALISMHSGANFSVPGSGKTFMTLAVWSFFREQIPRLLVVCPKSAFESWLTEARETLKVPTLVREFDESIHPKTDILFINYEQLENESKLNRISRWMGQWPTMLVIDEAHRIKGGSASVRFRACKKLAATSSRIDLLTGTPMPQGYEDLRNLLSLSWGAIRPHLLSNDFLGSLSNGGIFVRTTKTDLKLPDLGVSEIDLQMSPIQSEVYRALRRDFASRFSIGTNDRAFFARRGKAAMGLIACASNPGLLNSRYSEDIALGLTWPPLALAGTEELINVLHDYQRHEVPIKFQWVIEKVSTLASKGKKVIIWTSFVGNIQALSSYLRKFKPAIIYGAISKDDRETELNRFRSDSECSVLVTNAQTLGEGISLHHTCHEAIYIDRTYNANLYLQSIDRIHRLGLHPDQITKVHILRSNETIDQKISRSLQRKIERMAQVLGDEHLNVYSMVQADEMVNIPEEMLGMDNEDFNEVLNDILEHLKKS